MGDSNGEKVAEWMTGETLKEHLEPLLELYDVKDRNHGTIYVDHQPVNIETAQLIITDLSVRLGVPTQLIHSSLIDFGLLIDARSALPDPNEAVRAAIKERAWAAAHEDDREMDDKYDED